ncbi:hypothetical protein KUTeg_009867 [Tegillarca granosa]|uniref:DNA polymerase delta subunit 4 n=1 Tax=Tegillarca granosa TaxID=220873 RepID=A0ABQ9F584_TEGGR|nr:hypothetical protein KUTeg_009867 [Tegillarca granosa]
MVVNLNFNDQRVVLICSLICNINPTFTINKPLRVFVLLCSTNCERDLARAMSANKLITDSFSKVKHVPKGGKQSAGPKPSTSSAGASNNDLEILKQFDLALEYGPCIGITRLERWERAKQHGMNPPPEVKDILTQYSGDPEYTESLWKDYQL